MASNGPEPVETFAFPLRGLPWPGLIIVVPVAILAVVVRVSLLPIPAGTLRALVLAGGILLTAGVAFALHFAHPVAITVGLSSIRLRYLLGMSSTFERSAIRWDHSDAFSTLSARVTGARAWPARLVGAFSFSLAWLPGSERLVERIAEDRSRQPG